MFGETPTFRFLVGCVLAHPPWESLKNPWHCWCHVQPQLNEIQCTKAMALGMRVLGSIRDQLQIEREQDLSEFTSWRQSPYHGCRSREHVKLPRNVTPTLPNLNNKESRSLFYRRILGASDPWCTVAAPKWHADPVGANDANVSKYRGDDLIDLDQRNLRMIKSHAYLQEIQAWCNEHFSEKYLQLQLTLETTLSLESLMLKHSFSPIRSNPSAS